ncbi:helix-turn-helix domain-containing protein [Caenibacillus caldisaponilyticus]|jgi:transcriptional regulator with XRE-family HTH domain|uniref:helix-turn-helix domain-containing protein n=1 Tax=Caenibacillus caldisaponilyticus TaxID=1674942 RepID=UPI0009886A19|nr:helix-turn-helix transcriptional regulator [Caenibacillus caldisaponilyticus]
MGTSLGERIRHLRERKNLSQRRLADALMISNVQLSRYESGSRTPDPELIARIAKYFNVSSDYLLGIKDTVHESAENYLKDEDLALLKQIKKINGMEAFIRELVANTKDYQKIKKIWEIIKSP